MGPTVLTLKRLMQGYVDPPILVGQARKPVF
jgi:hypothetical protein